MKSSQSTCNIQVGIKKQHAFLSNTSYTCKDIRYTIRHLQETNLYTNTMYSTLTFTQHHDIVLIKQKKHTYINMRSKHVYLTNEVNHIHLLIILTRNL